MAPLLSKITSGFQLPDRRQTARATEHNARALRQDALKSDDERLLRHKLALKLIDRGFKALAAELHPDKGGSPEEMTRLNEVRAMAKKCVTGIKVFEP
jgi:hypothetical protein